MESFYFNWKHLAVTDAAYLADASYENVSAPRGWSKYSALKFLADAKLKTAADILDRGFLNDDKNGFIQVLKDGRGNYAVSFRGTDSLKDFADYPRVLPTKIKKILKIERDYINSFDEALETLLVGFKKLKIDPSNITFTGHSLGAAAVNQMFEGLMSDGLFRGKYSYFQKSSYIGFESPYIAEYNVSGTPFYPLINFGFNTDKIFHIAGGPEPAMQIAQTKNWSIIWTGGSVGERLLDAHSIAQVKMSLKIAASSEHFKALGELDNDFVYLPSRVFFVRGEGEVALVKSDATLGTTFVFGRNIDDKITGTKFDDVIESRGGNDTVYGGAGGDFLYGGAGNDAIWASSLQNFKEAYSEDLAQKQDRDYVYGGAGNDTIYGSSQHDYLYGEASNDVIYGGAGDDLIDGGTGADTYLGGPGVDTFFFGAGDTINDRRLPGQSSEDNAHIQMESILLDQRFDTVASIIGTIATKFMVVEIGELLGDRRTLTAGERGTGFELFVEKGRGLFTFEFGDGEDKLTIKGIDAYVDDSFTPAYVDLKEFDTATDKLDLTSAGIDALYYSNNYPDYYDIINRPGLTYAQVYEGGIRVSHVVSKGVEVQKLELTGSFADTENLNWLIV